MKNPERYGKWEVVEYLDEGGQGEVYRVRDTSTAEEQLESLSTLGPVVSLLAKSVVRSPSEERTDIAQFAKLIRQIAHESHGSEGALKKLLPLQREMGVDAKVARKRMHEELSILQSTKHPALVKVLDSDMSEDWFVMEYFEKGSLSNHLQTYVGRALDALKAFRLIVDAVSHLHVKGVVHRDIKPGNIFVTSNDHLVLGDCGLAFRLENQRRLTTTFENVGTRDFQPTWSQGVRLEDVTPAFDTFSLGKVLWTMVSGRPKFPLWYFDQPDHDLRKMYPGEPAFEYIHELLTKCVVEFERDTKLRDAGDLLKEVDATISAIGAGCQLPGRHFGMRCRFCGIGTYRESEQFHIVGNLSTGAKRHYFTCDNCGHVEGFVWANHRTPQAWARKV